MIQVPKERDPVWVLADCLQHGLPGVVIEVRTLHERPFVVRVVDEARPFYFTLSEIRRIEPWELDSKKAA